jgi:hypothetical protein
MALVVGAMVAWMPLVAGVGAASVEKVLRLAHQQYLEAHADRDVAALARIDGDLRTVMAIRPFVKASVIRPGYDVLGLQPMVFEGELLAYDGKVLREAHAIDPDSSARAFTLFSTIFPKGEAYVDVPDVAGARAYLREFPEGPFAAEVHLVLADFYDDLYKAVRAGESLVDYKRACFRRFITSAPVQTQLESAQRKGLTHYRQGLALRPRDERARQAMQALETGTTTGWHFCTD